MRPERERRGRDPGSGLTVSSSCFSFFWCAVRKNSPEASWRSTLDGIWAGGNGLYSFFSLTLSGFFRCTFFFLNLRWWAAKGR